MLLRAKQGGSRTADEEIGSVRAREDVLSLRFWSDLLADFNLFSVKK